MLPNRRQRYSQGIRPSSINPIFYILLFIAIISFTFPAILAVSMMTMLMMTKTFVRATTDTTMLYQSQLAIVTHNAVLVAALVGTVTKGCPPDLGRSHREGC